MKEARPTSGKVLLALFNILGNVRDLRFLDLFSGTGQVAKTALARGACAVVAVESERNRCVDIKKRITDERFSCLCLDVRRALPKLVKEGIPFNVIFADPPYHLDWGRHLPELLAQHVSLLAENGVFVFEHSLREPPSSEFLEGFSVEHRTYGETVLSFYRKGGDGV